MTMHSPDVQPIQPSENSTARTMQYLLFVGTDAERRFRTSVAAVLQTLVAVLLVAVWEIGAAAGWLDPFFYSRPSAIAGELIGWFATGYIWPHIWATLSETLLGFAIGTLAAVIVGFALGRSFLFGDIFEPFIAAFNGIPRIILAPLFLLWFGLGIESKVALVVTVIFPIVFYSVFSGIREADQGLIDNARVMGASRRDITWTVLMPSALSWIFSSLKVSVGFAISAAVVAEYMGANAGLGYVIADSFAFFRATGGFAAMLLLLVIVTVLNLMLGALSRRLMAWKI